MSAELLHSVSSVAVKTCCTAAESASCVLCLIWDCHAHAKLLIPCNALPGKAMAAANTLG